MVKIFGLNLYQEAKKQSPTDVLLERCSYKFCKIHRKIPLLESLLQQSCRPRALAEMLSCEFCETSKNILFL